MVWDLDNFMSGSVQNFCQNCGFLFCCVKLLLECPSDLDSFFSDFIQNFCRGLLIFRLLLLLDETSVGVLVGFGRFG